MFTRTILSNSSSEISKNGVGEFVPAPLMTSRCGPSA